MTFDEGFEVLNRTLEIVGGAVLLLLAVWGAYALFEIATQMMLDLLGAFL